MKTITVDDGCNLLTSSSNFSVIKRQNVARANAEEVDIGCIWTGETFHKVGGGDGGVLSAAMSRSQARDTIYLKWNWKCEKGTVYSRKNEFL